MVPVVIQPCRGKDAKRHWSISMERQLHVDNYDEILSPEQYRGILHVSPDKRFTCWGNTQGINGKNLNNVDPIRVGDIVLFTEGGFATHKSKVLFVFRNHRFGDELWGESENGLSYDYCYVTAPPERVCISYDVLNQELGYKSNFCFPMVLRRDINPDILV